MPYCLGVALIACFQIKSSFTEMCFTAVFDWLWHDRLINFVLYMLCINDAGRLMLNQISVLSVHHSVNLNQCKIIRFPDLTVVSVYVLHCLLWGINNMRLSSFHQWKPLIIQNNNQFIVLYTLEWSDRKMYLITRDLSHQENSAVSWLPSSIVKQYISQCNFDPEDLHYVDL